MAESKKRKTYSYIRTALEKYERITGKHLRGDSGVVKIAESISGKKRSKKASWAFIMTYCEGEHFVTRTVRRLRNSLRAGNRMISQSSNDDFYTKEKAKNFYQSQEWRILRVQIIEEQFGECQMCGRSYKKNGVTIHVDHIVPLSIDWSRRLDKSNLQLLCEDCNMGKSNHYSTDWRNPRN
jgi:5-methylcytosine-specific restriction endonuclease McrA